MRNKINIKEKKSGIRRQKLESENQRIEERGMDLKFKNLKFILSEGRFYRLPSNFYLLVSIIYILALLIATTPVTAQNLNDYLQTAAENNPDLQSKYKEFEAALQKIPQVSSLPDPTFSFSYNIPKMMSQSAEFSLMQTFPWFGTLKAQGDAAALMAEAHYQSFLDARNQLYYEVSAAYYPLYELERWKQIEQDNIDILQSYKSIANSKFKNGLAPMVDVLRVDIMLKDAVTNLNILEKKEKPLKTTFNKLINRDVNEEVIIDNSLAAEFETKPFHNLT